MSCKVKGIYKRGFRGLCPYQLSKSHEPNKNIMFPLWNEEIINRQMIVVNIDSLSSSVIKTRNRKIQ